MIRVVPSFLLTVLLTASASAQMPDVTQMSGRPLPSAELPTGTVSVRVLRGSLSNNVSKQRVELHGGANVLTADTDENGRAMFSGLAPGTTVHAITELDGQRLESEAFPVPASGGVRLMLVGKGGTAHSTSTTGASPAVPTGSVALGGQSRFVVDIVDEALNVYALLEVVNPQSSAVQPSTPLTFESSPNAGDVSILEGSSPLAKADGRVVRVTGSLPPGRTVVQFAYQIPYEGDRLAIRQALPLGLPETSLLVRRLQNVDFGSPQISERREVPIEGHTYYLARGPAIPAGSALEITLTGLPHHTVIPRYLALGLALVIIAAGAWLALRERGQAGRRESHVLEVRREQLFAQLVEIERRRRMPAGESRNDGIRREQIMTELERVLSALDAQRPAVPAQDASRTADGMTVDASLRTRRV